MPWPLIRCALASARGSRCSHAGPARAGRPAPHEPAGTDEGNWGWRFEWDQVPPAGRAGAPPRVALRPARRSRLTSGRLPLAAGQGFSSRRIRREWRRRRRDGRQERAPDVRNATSRRNMDDENATLDQRDLDLSRPVRRALSAAGPVDINTADAQTWRSSSTVSAPPRPRPSSSTVRPTVPSRPSTISRRSRESARARWRRTARAWPWVPASRRPAGRSDRRQAGGQQLMPRH